MKKWIIPAFCSVCAIFLIVTSISGHKRGTYTSIGKTYNKFLFIPAKSAHFTISFRSPYSGSLTLIDDKEKPLSSDKYTISIDGKTTGPHFSVKDKKTVHVSIRCTKSVSPGKQYVQVKGGGSLVTHVYFKHHLNPLFVWLSWIFTAFAVIALVWFLFIRQMVYPQFKSCRKTFFIPKQQPLMVNQTGARMVILSSEKKKQGFWDTLIKGPIIYKVDPAFSSPICIRPLKGMRILVKCDSSTYRISPNPIPYLNKGIIDNVRSNMQITIN